MGPLAGVLGIALALRVLLPLSVWARTQRWSGFYQYDTASYLQPAGEWLTTGKFAVNGVPELFRTPGYPLLLVPGLLVGRVEPVTIALQIGLGCLSVYLVYRIARLLFGSERVALFCAALYAFEPLAILYCSKLTTETLFTSLNLTFLILVLRYLQQPRVRFLVPAALLAAACVYVRPIAYSIPVWSAVLLLVWVAAQPHPWRRLAEVTLFLCLSMGVIGAWQIRNGRDTGYYGFSTVKELALYFFDGAAVLAVERKVPFYEMQDRLGYRDPVIYFREHPEQLAWNQARRYAFLGSAGLGIVRGDLPTYALIRAVGMCRTLIDPGGLEYLRVFEVDTGPPGLLGVVVDRGIGVTLREARARFRQRPLLLGITLALGLVLGCYYVAALAALLSRRDRRSIGMLLVLFSGLYLWLLSSGPMASERFRQPVMPVVSLLAGFGLADVTSSRTRQGAEKRSRR